MRPEKIRAEFPQTGTKVYGKPLVYLDNAATSLRPRSVMDKWEEMSVSLNSNLHRSVYHTASLATAEFEKAREAVASFIGAEAQEIIFTSGTTASINLLASCLSEPYLGNPPILNEGDEIIIAECEHHSDIVPWQMLASRRGIKIKVLPVLDSGELDLGALPSLFTDRTRLLCVAHISNVLGIINPVKEIVKYCHSRNCFVSVDGAQGIVHDVVDVRETDCDFYSFSAHKIYGVPGTGVLYGKKHLLEKMPPFMGGGEMIESVSWEKTTFAGVPGRFEAGTQNISGIPPLVPALQMLSEMRRGESLSNMEEIRDYVFGELSSMEGITVYGRPGNISDKVPLFSFSVEGVHHEDLAILLDKMGIAVRSGQMCAEPLMDRFSVSGMVRASFAPYNTMQEAEYFIQSLDKAIKMLK